MNNSHKKDYICDDTPIIIPEKIKNMTDEELQQDFEKRFGDFLDENDQ